MALASKFPWRVPRQRDRHRVHALPDGRAWMAEAGFRDSYVEPPVGPDSMVVGLK